VPPTAATLSVHFDGSEQYVGLDVCISNHNRNTEADLIWPYDDHRIKVMHGRFPRSLNFTIIVVLTLTIQNHHYMRALRSTRLFIANDTQDCNVFAGVNTLFKRNCLL